MVSDKNQKASPQKTHVGIMAIIALLVSSLLTFGMALLAIEYFNDYGGALFIGLPIFSGILCVLIYGFQHECTIKLSMGLSAGSGVLCCTWFLVFGLEGIICILMASPLLLLLGMVGGFIGRAMVIKYHDQNKHLCAGLLLLMPLSIALEAQLDLKPELRQVVSSVVIKGGVSKVWETVVQFPEIEDEPSGIFRFGIAYPIRASIEGTGVGAIRLCTFNTGDFVEPITIWDEHKILAFDVIENPVPMTETGFYEHIEPPHLHGFMVSEKGQFKLTDNKDGTITLEGTTWYHHDLSPSWYWGMISDEIIHRIHYRVLDHIKKHVEEHAVRSPPK